jgi:hypothetical protein
MRAATWCVVAFLVALVAVCAVVATRVTVHEAFVPGRTDLADVVGALLPQTAPVLTDAGMVLYDRAGRDVTLVLTDYDTPLHLVKTRRDTETGALLATLLSPYEMLQTNARLFPRFVASLLPSPTAGVPETTEVKISADGERHVMLFSGRTAIVKSAGLKAILSKTDLVLHDACKATVQNTFTTTEVAKFADIAGCTLALRVADPEFSTCFCIKRHAGPPQFVGVRRRGDDLQVSCYDMTEGVEDSAAAALDRGLSGMDAAGRRVATRGSALQGPLTTDAFLLRACADVPTTLKLEVIPGQLRVFVEGAGARKAYALAMPRMLANMSALQTDLSWPPQVAWRASSGTLALYTFPMCDLSAL